MVTTRTSAVGFRGFEWGARPSDRQLDTYRNLEVGSIADAMNGLGCMDGALRPVGPGRQRCVGPALTVTVTPGNGRVIRKAILVARPGDIVVVNGFGTLERAIAGGNVVIDMAAVGIAGLIIDGAIRDPSEIRAIGLPVFVRGITPRGGSDPHGRGEILSPAACGGVVVGPGDIVVADEDGIVVVPLADANDVAAKATAIEQSKGSARDLEGRMQAAAGGAFRTADPDAINGGLARDGWSAVAHPWHAAAVVRKD